MRPGGFYIQNDQESRGTARRAPTGCLAGLRQDLKGWDRSGKYLIVGSALLVAVFLSPSASQAQSFAPGARTEFQGGFAFRTFVSYTEVDKLLTDGDEVADPLGRRVTARVNPLAVVFGAQRRFSVVGVFPAIRKTFERVEDGRRVEQDNFGLGDIRLIGKYRFYKHDNGPGTVQLAVEAGAELPTGEDQERDDRGELLPSPLQLGSGSVDILADLTFGWTPRTERFPWIFNADVAVAMNTEANEVDPGDHFRYDLGAKYRLWPWPYPGEQALYVQLELNGVVSGRDEQDGTETPDSGGHEIYLSPGLFLFVRGNLMLEAAIQLPVLQDLNGTQLAKQFTFLGGLRYVFLP